MVMRLEVKYFVLEQLVYYVKTCQSAAGSSLFNFLNKLAHYRCSLVAMQQFGATTVIKHLPPPVLL